MFYRLVLIVVLLLTTGLTYSQDTTAVYFKIGSHKIPLWHQQILEKKFHEIDYANLTSITFIGYADSTGRIDVNQKLSERRAKTSYKFAERFLDKTIPFTIQSKGEIPRTVDSLSRRVDIVFHYKETNDAENDPDTLIIQPDDPRCFFIDQYIEGYSNAKIKVYKKKEVVYLQVLNYPEFSNRKYYYVKNPSQSTAVAQRVKFKVETTGRLWWRDKRLTATIPKDSYDKFGLFYLEKPPCEGCKEQLFKKDTNVFIDTRIQDDYFMMSVTQLKAKFFRRRLLQIRIPKEYKEENKSLYAIKTLSNSTVEKEKLIWETRKGKKKTDYLYAKIRTKGVSSFAIASPQRVSLCPIVNGGVDYNRGFTCGNRCRRTSSSGEFSLFPAIHAFYHNDTVTSFISVGLKYNLEEHEFAANIGVNHRLGLIYSAHYHFEMVSFNLVRNGWKSMNLNRSSKHLGIIYIGPEFRSSYTKRYRSFSELNLHVGFSCEWKNGFGYYIHGGIARDLSNRINTGFYPYVQAGIGFRFEL